MSPLVSQGLDLAMYGMGVVFVFLTLLVMATITMSKIVMMTDGSDSPAPTIDKKKLAAITAAVHQHRRQQS